jgi:hypothetical protein
MDANRNTTSGERSLDDLPLGMELDDPSERGDHVEGIDLLDGWHFPEELAPHDAPIAASPPKRDCLVILGRRAAGKSVYIARLYEMMWKGCAIVRGKVVDPGRVEAGDHVDWLHCRASGPDHLRFMQALKSMRGGSSLTPTSAMLPARLLIDFRGCTRVIQSVDCSGESFAKAFLHEMDSDDAKGLREAVDRAAGAILLVDPSVVAAGDDRSHEDTFGLMSVAERIRSSEGGASVPIVLLYTKYDTTHMYLREAGGLIGFTKRHFPQLLRLAKPLAVCHCNAIGENRDALNRSIPDMSVEPSNVVEPVRYCLDIMLKNERIAMYEAQRAASRGVDRPSSPADGAAGEAPTDVNDKDPVAVFVSLLVTVAVLVMVVMLAVASRGWWS